MSAPVLVHIAEPGREIKCCHDTGLLCLQSKIVIIHREDVQCVSRAIHKQYLLFFDGYSLCETRAGGNMKKKITTRTIVVTGMLSAVSIVLGMTPIGIIRLPIANLTTMHIPAILAGILEGPVAGLFVGLIFGLTSLYKAATSPTSVLSPFLLNPLVSLVPRMLIGVVAWAVYTGILVLFRKQREKGERINGLFTSVSSGLSAFFGTMTNTAGVMGMTYLLYAPQYAQRANIELSKVGAAIWGVVSFNGVLEAVAAVIIVVALERVLRPLLARTKKKNEQIAGETAEETAGGSDVQQETDTDVLTDKDTDAVDPETVREEE